MADVCGCYLCASDVDNWPAGTSDAQKRAIITKVEQLIDKVTNTHWCGEPFDIELNGNNKNRLFLPLHTNIMTVTNWEIDCVEMPLNWIKWDINSIYLDPCNGNDLWGTNYVNDGEFNIWITEQDLHYWSETIVPTSTVNRESADIQVGRYCCRLDIDAAGHEASIEQTLSLTTNGNFKLQFSYKNTATQKAGIVFPALADSATATTLRDVSVFDADDEFNDCWVLILSGTGTDNGFVQITGTIAATGDIVVAAWPGTQPDNTSRYIIVGTMKAKLYNPGRDESLHISYPDPECRHLAEGAWVAGESFFSLDPVTTWTVITIEFTSHADFVDYELVFANDTAFSSSIYIDNVSTLIPSIGPVISDDRLFPRGYNNIRVVGTMGEYASGEGAEVPEAIKQAAVIIAKWENDPTLYTTMGLKKSEKIGDYSYTGLASSEADVLTGIMEADMLLRHYVKRKAIVMAP